jgi:hypothetical protein
MRERGIAPAFLTLTLDGGEWSASGPGRFNPRERILNTHCIGTGWAPERVDKNFLFLPGIKPRPSST